MNELERMFQEHTGRMTNRYPHHMIAYHDHFSKFRDKEIGVLEIGYGYGGGLQLWKKYFGPKAQIFCIDRSQRSLKIKEDRIKVFIGDQENREFIRSCLVQMPKLSVVIDDGSHEVAHQILGFEEIFLKMADEAVYAIEDTHTSYRATHGGGYKKPGTTIEYCKDLIDALYAAEGIAREIEYFRFIWGITFYLGAIIIEKSAKAKTGPVVRGSEGKG